MSRLADEQAQTAAKLYVDGLTLVEIGQRPASQRTQSGLTLGRTSRADRQAHRQ